MPTGLVQPELLASLTEVGTALEVGVRGLQLAIRGEEFSRDQAKVPEQADKNGQSGLDGLDSYAAAEMTQIVLAPGIALVQPSEFAIAAALILLAQIGTEAGIVGVAIRPAGQLKEQGAGGIIAVAPFFGIVRGQEGASEALIDRRPKQPTEASLDLARGGELDRAWLEVVVRQPTVGGLREGNGEGLQGSLVQFGCLVHKGLQVNRGDVLLGQREFCSAQSVAPPQKRDGFLVGAAMMPNFRPGRHSPLL